MFMPKLRELEAAGGRANVMEEAQKIWARLTKEKGFFSEEKGFGIP